MKEEFSIAISYSQLVVYLPDIENPFSLWSKEQYEQGFVWREGTVSFGLPDMQDVDVTLEVGDRELLADPKASRSIAVPFMVKDSGVYVDSLFPENPHKVEVLAGTYQLVFELFGTHEKEDPELDMTINVYPVKVRFIPSEEPIFKILKADAELTRTEDLITTGEASAIVSA